MRFRWRAAARLRYHNHVQQFGRITQDPEVMGGKPCIRGMRVTVGMIVEALAAGRTIEQLLADFPYLEEQDIRAALGSLRGWRSATRSGLRVNAHPRRYEPDTSLGQPSKGCRLRNYTLVVDRSSHGQGSRNF
jgi:uncharacterized protein (DUF433 family)